MGSVVQDESSCSNGEMINCNFETNWSTAHGSLDDSINIESSNYQINHPDFPTPVVLKPHGTDSDPCEIKICFEQKYEIGLVYVRSSARIYEVYYARTPQGCSEYLCTVRCGVAERDDRVLTTAPIEDVSSENGGCSMGGVGGSVATDGETTVTSDDEWVKIKIPGVQKSSLSEYTSINRGNNVQDLYEATAQINDSEACSCLIIRLLSLQDRNHVHIDEVYVFVDPVESTDSENVAPALSSTQSPLMAMLMPTLMQLSASGRSKEKLELQKDDNVESGLERAGEVDVESNKGRVDTTYFKLKELDKDTFKSDENQQHVLDINSVKDGGSTCINDHAQYLKLKALDKGRTESDGIKQPPVVVNSKKGGESTCINDLPPGRLERSLELLLSRVRTVEDICLRFEEKMLKPIESMEAKLKHVEHQLEVRLQQVEHKLETRLQQVELHMEKLSQNIQNSGLPHSTRITAPVFSRSESNSSLSYNEIDDYAIINGASGIEMKDLSCNRSPYVSPGHVNSSPDLDIRPGLVVTAPEFSCGEDEDNNGEFETLKDAPPVSKPKPTLSVDDALAAALSGFLSTTKVYQPENVKTTSDVLLLSEEEIENKHVELDEVHQDTTQELPAAGNCRTVSLSFTGSLSIKDPEFIEEEIGNDEAVDYNPTSPDTVPIIKNVVEGHDEDKVAPSPRSQNLFSSNMCDLHANVGTSPITESQEKDHDEDKLPLSTCGGSLFTSADLRDLIVDYDNDEEKDLDTYKFAPSTHTASLFTDADLYDLNVKVREDELGSQSDHSFDSGHLDSICTNLSESSPPSTLDFEFPILEVKFTCDKQARMKTPLESLLEGEAEVNAQGPVYDCSVHGDMDDCRAEDVYGTTDLYSSNSLLVDIGCSPDGLPYSEGKSHDSSTPSAPEMTGTLI